MIVGLRPLASQQFTQAGVVSLVRRCGAEVSFHIGACSRRGCGVAHQTAGEEALLPGQRVRQQAGRDRRLHHQVQAQTAAVVAPRPITHPHSVKFTAIP